MRHSARNQMLLAVLVGLAAGLAVGFGYRGRVAPLLGFDAGALLYLGRIWLTIASLDADQTSQIAGREDPTRPIADLVLLGAAVASLAGVGVLVAQSRSATGHRQGVEVGVAVGSIVVSWLLVQTIFTLKYARLYYAPGTAEGGVEFENHVRPPYSDFAYLAFTIGMTFQVSDTDLQTTQFRALALRHALLSYLFGAVILAATINLVASLAS
jgi:uncharacterized membrane protein